MHLWQSNQLPQNLDETVLGLPPENEYIRLSYTQTSVNSGNFNYSTSSLTLHLRTDHNHNTHNTLNHRWKKPPRVLWVLIFRHCKSTPSEQTPTAATVPSTAAFNFQKISEERLENLHLQYHEIIHVYHSTSSTEFSPRLFFFFSTVLYLGLTIISLTTQLKLKQLCTG